MTRRVLSIVLAAYLALVLQAAALSQWGVGACAPALVLVVVTGIGLNDGWPAAGITALVCGLLLDRFLGNGTFSYTVPLLAAGLASGSRRFALGNEALPPLVLPAAGYVLAFDYPSPALERQFYLLHHRTSPLSPAAAMLLEELPRFFQAAPA